jgi:hypothetical protein
MTLSKIEKDSKSFLSGKWSAKRYANEIIRNTQSSRCGITIVSKPIPINILREKLAK